MILDIKDRLLGRSIRVSIIGCQCVLFFKQPILRADELYFDINKGMNGLFNSIPFIMPTSENAPGDFPIVSASDQLKNYQLNISKAKIDFFYNKLGDSISTQQIIDEFLNKSNLLAGYIIDKAQLKRIGLVTKYFFENKNAVKQISEKYIKQDSLTGSSEISLRFNFTEELKSVCINDLINISSQEMIIEGKTKYGVFVQRDINNVENELIILNNGMILDIMSKFKISNSSQEIGNLFNG